MPGQTTLPGIDAGTASNQCQASMEGRAIARPNSLSSPSKMCCTIEHSFNGGPGNCPAKRASATAPSAKVTGRFGVASMEGRAIARPNAAWGCAARSDLRACSLQWRAGQLPGQTGRRLQIAASIPRPERASMEGRAIARPNSRRRCGRTPGLLQRKASMEGRAIARPNTMEKLGKEARRSVLQWRAGQLPGQTRVLASFVR